MKVLAGHLQQEAHEGLLLSAPVREALSSGRAVVALESTIITHGMPFPQNLQTAREVERIVRDAGAEPATIAILDGQPCVGTPLSGHWSCRRLPQAVRKLPEFAKCPAFGQVVKTSLRVLPKRGTRGAT